MSLDSLVSLATALLSGALAAFVLVRNPRSLANLAFVAGMAALSLGQVLAAVGSAAPPPELFFWKRLELVPRAFELAAWLLFSLSFGRSDPWELVGRWKWFVAASLLLPLSLVTLFGNALFDIPPQLDRVAISVLPLAWAGKALFVVYLLGSAAILANLEGTLRATRGSKRWRLKFMLVGVGSYFGAQVYLCSQALLFSSIDLLLASIRPWASLVACALITVSLLRTREAIPEIQLSRSVVYNSLAVILVGAYLILVGVVAELASFFEGDLRLPLGVLTAFVLLVGLALLAFSDQLREELRRLVVQNFFAPRYDYRKEWTNFARRTTSLVDAQQLCAEAARIVSETFAVDSVTVWRASDSPQRVLLGGSTVLSADEITDESGLAEAAERLVDCLRDRSEVVDFQDSNDAQARRLASTYETFFRLGRVRYGVPLLAARKLVGVMTLGDRITGDAFTLEDLDLLRTIADQTAAGLLNLQLSEQLGEVRELEAFQTLSSFFVHDLKNLASMLSLTVQNLPTKFDNLEFRRDALKVIGDSVEKMKAMCAGLSVLGRKLELQRSETDLNALVRATLSRLHSSLKSPATEDLRPIPPLSIDAEQIEKVLVNLVLNANDAIGSDGRIAVSTATRDDWVVLTVSDSGQGLSEEFRVHRLFRPFQTTKSSGLGIGLFQSRRLVEAHGGRIEVETREGKGSSFRVLLPAATAEAGATPKDSGAVKMQIDRSQEDEPWLPADRSS